MTETDTGAGSGAGGDLAKVADSDDTTPSDTADTCAVVEGSGCGAFRGESGERRCQSRPLGSESGTDTAEGRIEGSGCASASVGSASLGLTLVAVALWRRLLVFLLVTFVLSSSTARAGVDAQTFHPLDGGPFPTLVEADLGPDWSVAGAWTHSFVRRPLVYIDSTGSVELLSSVWSVDRALSVNLGGYARLGFSWPRHRWASAEDQVWTDQPADLRLWTSIPLHRLAEDGTGWAASWTVLVHFATGADEIYLGDSNGGVEGRLAGSRSFGAWTAIANLGADLHAPVQIPGAIWGNRLSYGVGLRRSIIGPLQGSTELVGGAPLSLGQSSAALFPIESITALQGLFARGLRVTAGGGTGLSRGVGSPAWRVFASLGLWPQETADQDKDGVGDVRDRCRTVPEDRDGYRDLDGCPDMDDDSDGILDPVDACPREPEVRNGLDDEDGCPDAATLLQVVVRPASGTLDRATVQVGDGPARVALVGDPLASRVAPGPVRVSVSAPGYQPVSRLVGVVGGQEQTVEVQLQAVRTGALNLHVTDVTGVSIAATLRVAEEERAVPSEGLVCTFPEGPLAATVSAAGYRPEPLSVLIPAEGQVAATVVLQPLLVRLEGGALLLQDEVKFSLDDSALAPESLPALDDVAALLAAHPEIRLLRIEGHADDTGTPAYNLDLSRRRAEAVRVALLGRGVAPERLEAIGSGEAKSRADATASRRVEFLVLVWEEPGPRPEAPKGR